MASFNIHLAVAIEYMKKNHIENKDELFYGAIVPDLEEDKSKSHYTGYHNSDNLTRYLAEKVDLNLYLKQEEINTDYEKGKFLHLITDYLFFNNFFEENYIKNITYKKFVNDLYYSYVISNSYLEEKYNIKDLPKDLLEKMNKDIKNTLNSKSNSNKIQKNILPLEKLNEFIEKVSNIDLELYKSKILKAKKNVLP
ncbi:MAG: hypothetical protein HFJ45_00430 [Clostridia bacterium]|nr:hypothetical protein [Clostridia bacterium]